MVTTTEQLDSKRLLLQNVRSAKEELKKGNQDKINHLNKREQNLNQEIHELKNKLEMEEELERTSRFKPEFKNGDIVEIIANKSYHVYEIGDKVKILNCSNLESIHIKGDMAGSRSQFVTSEEIKTITSTKQFKPFGLMIETEEEAKVLWNCLNQSDRTCEEMKINSELCCKMWDDLDNLLKKQEIYFYSD